MRIESPRRKIIVTSLSDVAAHEQLVTPRLIAESDSPRFALTRCSPLGYDAQQYSRRRSPARLRGGAMYCSKCGANVADGTAFCSACGQPMVGFSVGPAAAGAPAALAAPGYAPAARPAVAYAGFWLRVVAFIIDAILLHFVSVILFLPFAASMGMGMRGMMTGRPPNIQELLPLFHAMFRMALIRLVLNWLYFALLESSSWQATLGKKALGLEVTDLDGNRISFGRATGRFFAKIISSLTLGIGYIMAGFTEKKQALHDMIAGTLVIRKL
jgi:uncharacterized RDD family membrane protein YckC